MKRITIEGAGGGIELEVEALDNATSRKISSSLPIESKVKRWGEEIYFDIGIAASDEGGTMDVNVGDVAYWPEGKCLCIFFGKTPASRGGKPAPASEVVIVGKARVNPGLLRKVKAGSKIKVK